MHVARCFLSAHLGFFRLHEQAPIGCRVGAVLLGLASLPTVLFLGIVVGGNLGGGWVGGPLGAGRLGVLVGIGVGLFAVTFLVGLPCMLAGFLAGGFAEGLWRKARTSF
jgi:hypothetical protein